MENLEGIEIGSFYKSINTDINIFQLNLSTMKSKM